MSIDRFMGMQIVVSPLLPTSGQRRMRLTERLLVSQKFRDETDAWLLAFFGRDPPINCLRVGDTIFVSRELLQSLRAAAGMSGLPDVAGMS